MSEWNGNSGDWGLAGNWIGPVPNSGSAVATFSSLAFPMGGNTALVFLDDATAPFTINRLEIFADAAGGRFTIIANTGNAGPVELRMGSGFGAPAFIDVDTNGLTNGANINFDNGLFLRLNADTIVQTRNSDSTLNISAPVIGTGGIQKYGTGTLILNNSASNYSGALELHQGTVRLANINGQGTGLVTFSGGTLNAALNMTLTNRIFVEPNSTGGGFLFADTDTTLTLESPDLTMFDPAGVLRLGGPGFGGTIRLGIDSFTYTAGASFALNGGTVRFVDDFNAQNAFRMVGSGEVEIFSAGTLDTQGRATFIHNLDMTGGTILSSVGPLDLNVEVTTSPSMTGTVQVSQGSNDVVRFTLNGSTTFSIANLNFVNWTDGSDKLTINGGNAAETISGSQQFDTINGGGGNDVLNGNGGDDFLTGGGGADTMSGGPGNDVFFVAQAGDSVIENPGEGTDEIRSDIDISLPANVENLLLRGPLALNGTGNELANAITAGFGPATLAGLGGDDMLFGSASADTFNGGDDNDTLFGRGGADVMNGDAGNDILNGQDQGDTLNGGGGNDQLRGDDGNDVLNGGIGNDNLQGGLLNDTLNGDAGIDALLGQDGNDTLNGGTESDILDGGTGRDLLTGGDGGDTFRFDDGHFSGVTAVDSDRIFDFSQAQGDKISLSLVDAIDGGSDDAFTFIGSAAFNNVAGELRFEQGGAFTLILGDTNGDGTADFAIRVDGMVNFVAGDFVL